MSVPTDHSTSPPPDCDIQQYLRWDATAQWIEVTHTINLKIGKDAILGSIRTYRTGDVDYNTICSQYGINPDDHWLITIYKYREIPGSSTTEHTKIFPLDGRPYMLSGKPHCVVGEFHKMDGTTSTTSGVAL